MICNSSGIRQTFLDQYCLDASGIYSRNCSCRMGDRQILGIFFDEILHQIKYRFRPKRRPTMIRTL